MLDYLLRGDEIVGLQISPSSGSCHRQCDTLDNHLEKIHTIKPPSENVTGALPLQEGALSPGSEPPDADNVISLPQLSLIKEQKLLPSCNGNKVTVFQPLNLNLPALP
jgi:hypothetical protein